MNKVEGEFVVGKYPASMLLNILSDGMDWSAGDFWAQINRYRWEWWYVDGISEVDRDAVKPDTSLIQMREHTLDSGYYDQGIDDGNKVTLHRVDKEDNATVCGIPYDETWVDGGRYSEECPVCIVWTDITLDKLAEATDWALENYNHLFSWHTNQQGIRDDIDYDAIGADVIIQKIVLGEVVYG